MDFEEFKRELLRDPEIKKEFERFDLPFEISKRIIELRILRDVTQKKLAELVGTRQSSISRAENGSNLPSLSFLNKIASALKTRLVVTFEALIDMSNINQNTEQIAIQNSNNAYEYEENIMYALISKSGLKEFKRRF